VKAGMQSNPRNFVVVGDDDDEIHSRNVYDLE